MMTYIDVLRPLVERRIGGDLDCRLIILTYDNSVVVGVVVAVVRWFGLNVKCLL